MAACSGASRCAGSAAGNYSHSSAPQKKRDVSVGVEKFIFEIQRFSLPGILRPERPVTISQPDPPDNPGKPSSHQEFYIKASDGRQNRVWKGHWTSVQKTPYPSPGNLTQ